MKSNSKLTVAHVIGSLQYGGAENQVIQLLNGLDSYRFEKYLVIFHDVGTENICALNPEISVFNMHLKRWGQLLCVFRLYRLFKHLKMDVVQAHMFHANLYAAIAARFAGVPIVFTTEHGKNLWKRQIHHFIERRIISPLVNLRVAVSKDIRCIRVNSGDVPRNKIRVITNCVAIPEKIAKKESRRSFRIGTVGRLVPAKDYKTLITAFKMLIKDGLNADLIFIGDGPERAKLESMVRQLDISDHVTFEGFQANVNSFLSEFDIFVLSSIREGIPVAMLEAMAMGVPVLATNVGGIPEVVQNNMDGILVEAQNPEMLGAALRKLSIDRSFRKKLGDGGREKVKSQFSRQAICKQYEQLIFDFLGTK